MVVYRKDPSDLETPTGTTAAQSVDQSSNEAEKSTGLPLSMVPRAVLICRPNSHPFQERHLALDQPVKVGRSVARCRPATNNAIFDCKVLSRNHALLWYENGKFYLQDTKSSNGTFVNNQRLSKGSEESPAREVCSGDIVQFGVDVVENSRKVTHGCIVATLKLFLPDGKEAKASPTTTVVPAIPEATISTHDLYQLSQYLQEALHREQILENKLITLQKVMSSTQEASDNGWKALIDEDRLLSRIETLESQLQACSRNFSDDKVREEIIKLQEEKDKYQNIAKNTLSNTEEKCSHLREVYDNREKELRLLTEKNDKNHKEIIDLNKKLQESLRKVLQEKLEAIRKVQDLEIESIQADCDFTKQQLVVMKARFEQMKKEHNLDENVDSNGISIITQDVILPNDDDEIGKLKAQLRESKEEEEKCSNLAKELQAEVNRLEIELQKVQTENDVNTTTLTIVYPSNKPNGDLHDEIQHDNTNELQKEVQKLKVRNDHLELSVRQLACSVTLLQELLAETRQNKKIIEEEILHLREQLNESEVKEKKMNDDTSLLQQQLQQTKKQLNERSDVINKLQEQLSNAEITNQETKQEISVLLQKLNGEEQLSHLKQEETNTLKTLEEQEAHQKLIENLEQTKQQLQETQQICKQSQNEAEQLKMKIKILTEDAKSQSNHDKTLEQKTAECNTLQEECALLRARIKAMEAEIRTFRNENIKLQADYACLQESNRKLESFNLALENKGGDYLKETLIELRKKVDSKEKELKEANEEILLLKEKFAECSTQKANIQRDLDALTEEFKLVTLQTKTVSACSFIPLIILLLAIIIAFYPFLSHLTATADSTNLT
ncbi:sarcolemmal membrane-associated protein-like [Centruroides sculpturatus]|uniref:sarcolemmal membrane-associated protein-like n=1 Tax=Centruroides sculpturatus TaxID=218467 RepID=UPI000C6D5CA3|nr:sarcolemmal membrane-associated protein-like [Centruroides sculpturatus]